MWRWFKTQNTTVKGMIIIGILFIIGIILRWNFIKEEVTSDFNNRFGRPEKTEQTE